MTLTELYDKLDWTEVDATHIEWEKDHAEAIRLDPAALRPHRSERLYNGLDALENNGDARHWWTLPPSIRAQVAEIYLSAGLIDETAK